MPTINPANPKEVILAILNQSSGTSVEVTDVDFSTPQRATGGAPLRNTRLVISPKANSGYYGNKVIWYNRIHISDLGSITVNKGTATLYSQLIPAINAKYGIYLSIDDIVDGPLPVGQTGEIVVSLPIKSSSLMFYSGAKIITPGFNPGTVGNVLTPAIWDSLIKSSLITITPNDFEVASAIGVSMIRTTTSFSTGKRYFELVNNSQYGIIGFGTAAATTSVLLGSDANSWALDTYSGLLTNNGTTVLDLSSQVSLMGNLPVGFMLDLDAKELTLVLSGNLHVPVTGLTLPNEAIFVMAGNKSNTNAVSNIRANFGNESFVYNVPFGYYPGFGSGGSPVYPTAGSLISQGCNGVDLMGVYANGNGGSYTAIIQANSSSCGGSGGVSTTPPPTTTAPPTVTTTTISVDTITATIDENAFASATYTLTPAINQIVSLEAYIIKNNTDFNDYGTLEINTGSGWTQVPLSNQISIPANAGTFSLRLQMVEDHQTEGTESFDFHVEKPIGSTNVSNTTPIIKTFTINDTSVFVPTLPTVTENLTLTGSSTLVIPVGVMEATVVGKGQTGVDAVYDNITSDLSLYFRRTTEATTGYWSMVITNYNGSAATEAIRISNVGVVEKTTDGTSWTPTGADLAGNYESGWSGFVNGYYYVISYSGNHFRSADGITWVALTGLSLFNGMNIKKIIFGNGIYFLCSGSSYFASSTDGVAFTTNEFYTVYGSQYTSGFLDVEFGDGKFVGLYADNNHQCVTTTDFITLTKHAMQTVSSGAVPRTIIYNGTYFIATTYVSVAETQYQSSTDGITWTIEYFPGDISQFQTTKIRNEIIASHSDRMIRYYSTDGINWEDISSTYPIELVNLYFLNGKFRTQPFMNQYGTYIGERPYVGGPEVTGTNVLLDPAITGASATVELLSVTHTYPGSSNSTPPTQITETIAINQPTPTTVTYVAPAGTTVSLTYVRDEANGLLVADPTNTANSVIAEGTSSILTYNLEVPLERIVNFTFNTAHVTSDAIDVTTMEYSVGATAFQQIADGDVIAVPIGQTQIRIKINAYLDNISEADESLSISLTKEVGTEVVLNSNPVTQIVTITNVVNNVADIVAPTTMNFFRATKGIDRSITDNNRVIFNLSNSEGIFSRDSVTTGRHYFEANVGGAFTTGTTKLLAGLATANLDVGKNITGSIGNRGALLSLLDGDFYDEIGQSTNTVGTVTTSTVFGFAYNADTKVLDIYKDNVLLKTKTLTIQNNEPVFIYGGCKNSTAPGTELILNTGKKPFAYTPPVGYSKGFGDVTAYIDNFETNNRNYANATPATNIFDTHVTTAVTQSVTGAYNQTNGYLDITFSEVWGPVSFLLPVEKLFKDIRLTVDIEYLDGADLGSGNYEENKFGTFVVYSADNAKLPLVTDFFNRLSSGGQLIQGGSASFALPRVNQDFSGRGAGADQTTAFPFSGRHTFIYEVVKVPTGKHHTIFVDGVVIASFIDTVYTTEEEVGIHLTLGTGGAVKMYKYQVDNIAEDAFDITDPITGSSLAFDFNSSIVSTDNNTGHETFSILTSPSFISTTSRNLYFTKRYWEFAVYASPTNLPDISVGIIDGGYAQGDPIDFNTYTSSIVALGQLNATTLIKMSFDPVSGILTYQLNSEVAQTLNIGRITESWVPVIISNSNSDQFGIVVKTSDSIIAPNKPVGFFAITN